MAARAAGNKKSGKKGAGKEKGKMDIPFRSEVVLLLILAACIVMLLSNFGFGGFVGEKVSGLCFGLFGVMAYVFPVCFFVGAAFFVSNKENGTALVKIVAGIVFVVFLCLFLELLAGGAEHNIIRSFAYAVQVKSGGGAVGGLVASLLCPAIGIAGTYVVDVIALIISLVILTERSFLKGVQKGSRKVYETARQDVARRRVGKEARKEKQPNRRMDRKVSGVALDTKLNAGQQDPGDISELSHPEGEGVPPIGWLDKLEAEESLFQELQPEFGEGKAGGRLEELEPIAAEAVHKPLRGGRPAPSAAVDPHGAEASVYGSGHPSGDGMRPIGSEPSAYGSGHPSGDGMRPIGSEVSAYGGSQPAGDGMYPIGAEASAYGSGHAASDGMHPIGSGSSAHGSGHAAGDGMRPIGSEASAYGSPQPSGAEEGKHTSPQLRGDAMYPAGMAAGISAAGEGIQIPNVDGGQDYKYPSVSLLKKGKKEKGDSRQHLQATAMNLQQILKNFGVNVTVTDVSCGPSVTRYELQPEVGVKVSKIVNLADDIKLNLAAADIRIEAPIPGKAAVGIEVPNQETVMVRFRDLVESAGFQNHDSGICFTVGKDIGGQPIVADIAKMPHLLIAGATGSGKSVCINTIIMSILYKANPEDVKLILIDPKVVELSVYNGIPHLLIPVVTDPKKAAGALHWAVSEMMGRYQKFSDCQVRDLKGYNKKAEAMGAGEEHQKMPQIVVVVDELADLMMVASKEVEDAICRLAQLARAAGIHLIIATQRPSVDVITGLIKANMPSRIAFSVSSSVDSRTILDMHGAEKLLGNGDMLFYPQGYPKPLRVQAPFVSDQEVEAVVDFLKGQSVAEYSEEVEEQVNTVSIDAAPAAGIGGESDRDSYFVEAGRFVVEKEKGSIGMLQRMFKIGFNRAARIMDQLEEAGVVGPEEGTKPRKILMSLEEFEQYVADGK